MAKKEKRESGVELYKLKAGSYSVGYGANARHYRANEVGNNIVPSKEDLAKMMPEKFEVYDGPTPDYLEGAILGTPTAVGGVPTSPPSESTDGGQAPRSVVESSQRISKLGDDEAQAAVGAPLAPGGTPPPKASNQSKEEEEEEEEEEDDGLGDMTVEELRALADKKKVEVPSRAKKDEIIQVLRNAE